MAITSSPPDTTLVNSITWTVSGKREDGVDYSASVTGPKTVAIPTGTYTVSFPAQTGWCLDASSFPNTTITEGNTTSISTQYRKGYSITATAHGNGTVTPASDTVCYGSNSQTFSFSPSANHEVVDVVIDGTQHLGPKANYQFLSVIQNHTIDVYFEQSKGNLTVTINPTAVRPTARWCVNGTCYTHGQTATLPVGSYWVTFTGVSGYNTPAKIPVVIGSGDTLTRIVTYTKQSGSLTVTINPTAVRTTARWCVNGTCYAHGKTITLPTGNYTVTFTNVANYSKPPYC